MSESLCWSRSGRTAARLLLLSGLFVSCAADDLAFCLPSGGCYNVSDSKGTWAYAEAWCKSIDRQLAPASQPNQLFEFLPGAQRFWITDPNPSDGCTVLDKYYSSAGGGLDVYQLSCQSRFLALCQLSYTTSTTSSTTPKTSPTASTFTPSGTATSPSDSSTAPRDSSTTSTLGTGSFGAQTTKDDGPSMGLIIGVAAVGFVLVAILISVLVVLAFHCLKKPKPVAQNNSEINSQDMHANRTPSGRRAEAETPARISDIWPMSSAQSNRTSAGTRPSSSRKGSAANMWPMTPVTSAVRTDSTKSASPSSGPADPVYSNVDEMKPASRKSGGSVQEDLVTNSHTQPIYSKPTRPRLVDNAPGTSAYDPGASAEEQDLPPDTVIDHEVFQVKDHAMLF